MSKLVLFLCIAFLAVSIVVAQSGCKPPGFICSSDSECCEPFACNPWAGRCTKPIDPATGGAATRS
ncbi:omega-conotoxin-like protein 1 [Nasonia vitripennis]|uniref:Uncharacterized protein n=1 Tax=Nasonia vitripennis TaxID=7425 RepID=A0A7M7H3F8_NASVI|nr:omega-conotoxin-like protein 1 [Nasonia vitripennis]